MQVQFLHDAAAVRLHSVDAEVQHTCDFLVGFAVTALLSLIPYVNLLVAVVLFVGVTLPVLGALVFD